MINYDVRITTTNLFNNWLNMITKLLLKLNWGIDLSKGKSGAWP